MAAAPPVGENAPSAPRALLDEIERFFRDYGQAFDNADVERVAALHNAPCLKAHGDGSIQCLETPEAVHAFFRQLMENYRARGLHSGRFVDLEVSRIGAQAALASLTWELHRADGGLLRRFRRSYNLVRTESGWRILVASAHRE